MKHKELPGFSLDTAAFRLSALYGSIPMPVAGYSNSPLDSQVIRDVDCRGVIGAIDYLSCCFDVGDPLKVVDILEALANVSFDCSRRSVRESECGQWYRISGSFGSCVEFLCRAEGTYRCRVTLPGRVCSYLSDDEIRSFLEYCSTRESFSPTRIDFRADDHNGILSLSGIRGCLERGDYSGFRCGEAIQSYGGKRAGETVYFGGRKSEERLRFYDKAAESSLDFPCVRQELQLRGKRARQAVEKILGNPEVTICDYALVRLSTAIEFGERKGKNLERMLVAEFWTEWRDLLVVKGQRREPLSVVSTIGKTLDWMSRAVSRSLAKAAAVLPESDFLSFIDAMILAGRTRLQSVDVDECINWARSYSVGDFFPSYYKLMEMVQ